MRKARVKHGFTLIEIVIVLVVLALLIGVLFRVYKTISDISVRMRYEKTM
jgi:prepilin-type N-terminal cleavage/methylation domain-containing protein